MCLCMSLVTRSEVPHIWAVRVRPLVLKCRLIVNLNLTAGVSPYLA